MTKFPPLTRNRPLLSLCLAVFFAYLGAGMVSTVRVLYVHHHGGSFTVIGAMAAAFFVANIVFQYPWGWASDRWGRRRVILIGLVWQAATAASYIVIRDPWLFVAVRFIEGAGAASILPAARAAIADMTPESHRGRAYGTFTAFFNLGFLFGPAAGGLLAAVSFNIVFILAIAGRLIATVIVFSGLPALRHDSGLQPGDEPHITGTNWRSLVNVGLVAAYLITFGDYLWLGFDQTLGPLWMRHHLGASLALIGIAYSVWSVPGTFMAPIGGRLADKYRRSRLVVGGGLAQVPMYLLYAASHSIYPVMAGFVIHSILYSIVSPSVDSHLAAASPRRLRGRVQSIYASTGVAGALAGASLFVPLYAVDFRLPLLIQGAGYGIVIIIGGYLMSRWERGRLRTPSAGAVAAAL